MTTNFLLPFDTYLVDTRLFILNIHFDINIRFSLCVYVLELKDNGDNGRYLVYSDGKSYHSYLQCNL